MRLVCAEMHEDEQESVFFLSMAWPPPVGEKRKRKEGWWAYDASVGGGDHERVEGEHGDGAQGEGGAGNLGRRHPCQKQAIIQSNHGVARPSTGYYYL